jgi:hypothetical protein
VHEPDAPELTPDLAAQAILDQGTRVGQVARAYLPGGQLIELPHDAFEERIAATRSLLEQNAPVIYEPSFSADDVYVAVDILEEASDGFHLIEVKSATEVKEENIPDIAIQLYVLRRAGVGVSRVELMHLNRECAYPDLDKLFVREDVTAEAEALQAGLPDEISVQISVLAGDLPDRSPGPHCFEPYDCPFYSRCSRALPPHHVSTLYRVSRKGADLIGRGFETIDELPTEDLNPIQKRQQQAVRTSTLIVEPGLAEALQSFGDPLAFLDFETVGLAIPVWAGCHPYDAVPAQYSFDSLTVDGTISHDEWIAQGSEDPRPAIASRLVKACRGAETVVAYNAGFERRAIELLAAGVPDLAGELLSIAERLADLLPVVRDYVYHPDFRGSFSLKRVLPALCPGPGYDELEVAEGSAASVELERLMFSSSAMAESEKASLRTALLRYCALDTMSLARLLQRLRQLASTA